MLEIEIKPYQHAIYGQYFLPVYNPNIPFTFEKPDIYNAFGEKMDIFFLRDTSGMHNPTCISTKKTKNRYMIWDRFNFGLDTHFYTDTCVVHLMRGGGGKISVIMRYYKNLEVYCRKVMRFYITIGSLLRNLQRF